MDTKNDCRKLLFIISISLTAVGLITALSASGSIAGFADLYRSFGADLPGITIFMLRFHYLGLILPGSAALYCIYFVLNWHKVNLTPFVSFIALAFVGAEIWRQLFTFAINLPIFQMGRVVNGI